MLAHSSTQVPDDAPSASRKDEVQKATEPQSPRTGCQEAKKVFLLNVNGTFKRVKILESEVRHQAWLRGKIGAVLRLKKGQRQYRSTTKLR